MARLVWTEPALADLQAIAEYIALDNPAAAAEWYKGYLNALSGFAAFLIPASGRLNCHARPTAKFLSHPAAYSTGVKETLCSCSTSCVLSVC